MTINTSKVLQCWSKMSQMLFCKIYISNNFTIVYVTKGNNNPSAVALSIWLKTSGQYHCSRIIATISRRRVLSAICINSRLISDVFRPASYNLAELKYRTFWQLDWLLHINCHLCHSLYTFKWISQHNLRHYRYYYYIKNTSPYQIYKWITT